MRRIRFSSLYVFYLSLAWVASPVAPIFAEPAPGSVSIALSFKMSEADAFLSKKEYEKAIPVLKKILEEEPTYIPAAIKLSRALAMTGKRKEGIARLRQILRQAPPSQRPRLRSRIEVLSKMFMRNETFQLYQDGVNFIEARKYGEARERFARSLEKEPYNSQVLARLGQVMVMGGDFVGASEQLEEAKTLNPGQAEVYLWLGRAFFLSRGANPRESARLLDRSLEELVIANDRLKFSELAPVWLAEALIAKGERSRAIDLLERTLKKRPYLVNAVIFLAQNRYGSLLEASEEELWQARKDFQLALSRLSNYEKTLKTRQGSGKRDRIDEGELGFNPYDSSQVKTRIEKSLAAVEEQIEKARSMTEVDGRRGDQN